MNKQRIYCKLCPDTEMWLTLREAMTSMESPEHTMPCGHDWLEQDMKRKTWELIEASEALDTMVTKISKAGKHE